MNGYSANLRQIMWNLKLNAKHKLCVIKSESEFSVKGSGASPHDSSKLWVEMLQ